MLCVYVFVCAFNLHKGRCASISLPSLFFKHRLYFQISIHITKGTASPVSQTVARSSIVGILHILLTPSLRDGHWGNFIHICHSHTCGADVSQHLCKPHFSKCCPMALQGTLPIYTPTCRAFTFLALFIKILFQSVLRFCYIFVWLDNTCRYKQKEDREKLGELWPSWPLSQ